MFPEMRRPLLGDSGMGETESSIRPYKKLAFHKAAFILLGVDSSLLLPAQVN